jgi:NAD(P)-dependent dehydrogenase (short-subunit alcohol dehydrogenase family)
MLAPLSLDESPAIAFASLRDDTVGVQRFGGKFALVTGAGHGIGRASAIRLAQEGAVLGLLDIDKVALAETSRMVSALGTPAHSTVCDVSDEESVTRSCEQARETFGAIDVLHSNAGVLVYGSAHETTTAEWERLFAVNVRGMFLMARAVLPWMMERRSGAIVNTASISGLVGDSGLFAYSASKGAVVNMTRQISCDYAQFGIRANCVCPGWVDTGFGNPLSKMTREALDEIVRTQVPIGRQGRPEEIAAVVAFLASDDASYVTGHALVADGGTIEALK